jgi:hypothetical protein
MNSGILLPEPSVPGGRGVGSALSADPAAPRAPTPRLRPGGASREGSIMSSSLTDEITIPRRPGSAGGLGRDLRLRPAGRVRPDAF